MATHGLAAVSLAAIGFTLASLSVSAQGGTAEERTACMSDAMAYCSAAIPNEDRIEACLRRESSHISSSCRAVLSEPATVNVAATGSARRR